MFAILLSTVGSLVSGQAVSGQAEKRMLSPQVVHVFAAKDKIAALLPENLQPRAPFLACNSWLFPRDNPARATTQPVLLEVSPRRHLYALRWALQNDRVWMIAVTDIEAGHTLAPDGISVVRIPFAALFEGDQGKVDKSGTGRLLENGKVYFPRQNFEHRPFLDIVMDLFKGVRQLPKRPGPFFYFDLQPSPKGDEATLFLLGKAPAKSDVQVFKVPLDSNQPIARLETVSVAFNESFHALADGQGSYFFVTDSGKAFAVPKPAAGKSRIAAELRKEQKEERLLAIVSDLASGKHYVAGRRQRNEKDESFYFELAQSPEVQIVEQGMSFLESKDARAIPEMVESIVKRRQ